MFLIFDPVKKLLKLEKITTDNWIFRCHYKVTFIILLVFSLWVTANQYIGDPIDCIIESSVIPQKIMDTYCWTHSTFSIRKNGTQKKTNLPPGLGTFETGDQIKHHKYYQWVCFMLFFQAILFYAPRFLWKSVESGLMKTLVMDLNLPILPKEKRDCDKKIVLDYLMSNLYNHNKYAFTFFICEVFNFINVIGQIYFIDLFLDGEFRNYGSQVVAMSNLDPEDRVDPMSLVFPKVTKCTFNKVGSSGTIEPRDGLCILPLNIVNEKIYIFLWFWFTILAILTGLAIGYRIATIVWPRARLIVFESKARLNANHEVQMIASRIQIGDWFVLMQLGKNMNAFIFKELITEMAHCFDQKSHLYGMVNPIGFIGIDSPQAAR